MRMRTFTGMLALAALLAGCAGAPAGGGSGGTGGEVAAQDSPVVGPRWRLLLIGTDERWSGGETPYFEVGPDGRVSGYDGCNRITGEVEFGANNRIDFGRLAATRKACPNLPDAQRVAGMLQNAYRYLIDHDRLVFFGPDSRVLGGFRRRGS